MKKLFLIPVAALAFAACSNDEVISENTSNTQLKEIAFAPVSQKATRAISNANHGYINGTTFDNAWGMTVSAVDVTKSDASFFAETNFVYNSTPALWEGETHRYWPLSPVQVNFLAIAHANGDNSTGVTWTANNTSHQVQVVMSDNYAYNTAQRDFLYAIGNGQVTQIGNNLSFPAKVDMNFQHTQAYLVFNLKAADAASCGITITNVELKGVYTAGTALIARADPDGYADPNVNLTWSSRSGTAADTYRSVTPSQNTISEALTQEYVERGHLLIVPNMTTANTPADNGTTKLKISYTLNENAYTYEYEIAEDTYDAGKKYIYNITFKLHEIFIDPIVTDWADGGTTNIDIPSVAYNESGANVSIGATAGTYTFTISGVPANGGSSYSVIEKDVTGDTDFITEVNQTNTTTDAAVGTMTITVKTSEGAADSHRAIVIKLGETEKMVVTLTKKTSI